MGEEAGGEWENICYSLDSVINPKFYVGFMVDVIFHEDFKQKLA